MRILIKLLLSLLLIVPLFTLFYLSYINYNQTDILEYFKYFNTTAVYVGFTTILSVLIGTASAYAISMYNFPYRDWYQKLYILPLLFPSYMMALIYGEISSSFMNLWGLIFISTIVSIPYVYLIMYSHISSISKEYLQTANTFNISSFLQFRKILLPLIIPGMLLSSMVVMSDSLSEFGASFFYGIDTIMVVIYEEWFGVYNVGNATLLSSITMLVIFSIFYFKNSLKKDIVNPITAKPNKIEELSKGKGILVSLLLLFPVIVSLVIPLAVLNEWFILSYSKVDWSNVWVTTFNTLSFSIAVVFTLVIITISMLYIFKDNKIVKTLIAMNYAIPGLFLSIIILSLITNLSFYTSLAVLFLAFIIKYNMLMISSVEGYTSKIDRRLYYSTKAVGKTSFWFINNIQIPMATKGILLGSVLVFIDVVRELPMMLTLRPFNFETLSTQIFYYYDSEWIYYTAPYFVVMLLVTLIPVLFIVRQINGKN